MVSLRSVSLVAVGILALMGAGSVAEAAPTVASTVDSASTSTVVSTTVPGHFIVDGARIHYRPDLNSNSVGLGHIRDSVTLYCRTRNLAFYHIRDNTTGVVGWASDEVVYPNTEGIGYC